MYNAHFVRIDILLETYGFKDSIVEESSLG